MTLQSYLQALIILLILLTIVVFVSGGSRFGVNWSTQRLINGKPREWLSAEHVHRRRQGMIDLLTPAVVAYGAAIAAQVGINELQTDWPGWARLLESPGVAFIVGGGVMIFIAAMVAITRTPRNPWTLVDNSETLLLFVAGAEKPVDPATYESWQRRFAEITERETAKSDKGVRAQRYWFADPSFLGSYPNPLTGRITDRQGKKHAGPTWALAHKWSWQTSKVDTIITYIGVAAAAGWASIVVLTFALNQTWTPFLIAWFSLMGLFLTVGLYLSMCAMRLDLIWWSKLAAERSEFRREIKNLLEAHAADRVATEDEAEPLLQELKDILHGSMPHALHEPSQDATPEGRLNYRLLVGASVLSCVLGIHLGRQRAAR